MPLAGSPVPHTKDVLRLERVSQVLGGNRIIDDLSLNIADGAFTAILGPSGCGKSTTLRIMAGLNRPTSGQVLLRDRDVTDERPSDRNVAMVFQSYALYPHLTVAENIALPLTMRECGAMERLPVVGRMLPGMPAKRASIRTRVLEIARMLDIEPLLDRKPGELSGGQQQRAAVGRALVRDPSLFLLDEPLSNLDAKLRVQMREELSALHRRSSKAFVYVTHDQTEAMTMADRVLLMLDGRIVQDGPPRELYERPVNRDVAGFIGADPMNLIDLPAPGADEKHPLNRLRLDLPPGIGPVCLGIRPEHVRLGTEGPLAGNVEHAEYHGRDVMITIRLEGPGCPVKVLHDQESGTHEIGARVRLACDPKHIHLFDRASGSRFPDVPGRTP